MNNDRKVESGRKSGRTGRKKKTKSTGGRKKDEEEEQV